MSDLAATEFVIFDVETTGLSPFLGDRVIEIAALRLRGLKPVDQFQSLVNPHRSVSYGAYLVNHIDAEMLAQAPEAQEVFPAFMKFAGDAHLVAHNIRFDWGFLQHELKLLHHPLPQTTRQLDTVRMARGLLPGLSRYSLASVAQALAIEIQQQHRAMSDVTLTSEVFKHLVVLAQEQEVMTVERLLQLFGWEIDC